MKTSSSFFLAFFLFLFVTNVNAQENVQNEKTVSDAEVIEKKVYTTKSTIGNIPTIDGKLDDACWANVEWGGDFIQQRPYEKEAPDQQTAFKILYDAKNLYVAFRCYDKEPDNIVQWLSRRDEFVGDFVEINIDSYHDLQTAFSFTITAAGVKGDEFISNNGDNWDGSWDPIWYVKTSVDDKGWVAELRIPLSQLRFSNKEEHIWGLQFTRRIQRKQERSIWQHIPQTAGGWVSEFGELHGIKGVKPQKQVEIQPYVLGQAETFEKEEGNPFATGSDTKLSVGVDGKIGITSDLILDFTINPDFGQVEADPSVLALDGFQVFFSERRPFFIEGRNIFDFRVTNSFAGGPFNSDNLFYSRRIGRSPHGYPDTEDNEYVDQPSNTAILGAAKFSGKTKNGWSIGILESVTAETSAEIDNDGERREEIVEPLSNYFVGRLRKDMNEGNTIVGIMLTSVNRKLENTNLDFLHKSAYTGGLDFQHFWKNRKWYVNFNTIFSDVQGSETAILETQESHERYFQRPDAPHLSVDPTLTSLAGYGSTFKIGKGSGNWKFDAGVTARSPGLELNDIGFLRQTDEVIHFLWTGYRFTKPFSIFRNAGINYNHWLGYDFSGKNTFVGFNANFNLNFKNNWGFGTGTNNIPKEISNTALRGGPSFRNGKIVNHWLWASTDETKKISMSINLFNLWGEQKHRRTKSYSIWLSIRPMRTLQLSLSPGYTKSERTLQYVSNEDFGNETRYLNGYIDQETFSASIRVNYTIKPNLTIQYYGQPFITKGIYSDFKYIIDPHAENYRNRFEILTDQQISLDSESEVYSVDENLDGTEDYSFDSPDFNFMEFRSNLVVRWEYIPGSELFLVWSQGTSNNGDPREPLFQSLSDDLFGETAQNIFLVKCTYRFLK